ncbi:hypothetical protein Patl1_32449 [Pistacia atlantica]|uniref:Uncharacterized protein n=1 Tax=Pistacia atlantica TaxID=434234 RepID=A0ACC1ANC6_9ROSI|nr:hypothetical protein Patl1_32449 [Pistacia atlantica]
MPEIWTLVLQKWSSLLKKRKRESKRKLLQKTYLTMKRGENVEQLVPFMDFLLDEKVNCSWA